MNEKLTRISLSGIDGTGKTTVGNITAQTLSHSERVLHLGIGIPPVVWQDRQPTPVAAQYQALLQSLQKWSRRTESQSSSIYNLINGLQVIFSARFLEPYLEKKFSPSLTITDRDWVIDTTINSTAYSPTLARVPLPQRLGIIQQLTAEQPRDQYVLLTVAPEIALQRIDVREHLDPHENLASLERLQSAFHQAFDLKARQGALVTRIDTSLQTPPVVVQEFIQAIK